MLKILIPFLWWLLGVVCGIALTVATHERELNRLMEMAEQARIMTDYALAEIVKLEEMRDGD